jgi:hypothetical protein
MKCVRQRCQLAPVSVEAIASTSPGWASEETSRTPVRPRADELPQESQPGRPVLARDHIEPERLAVAVAVDGNRVHDAGVNGPAAVAALDLERVEHEIRVGARLQRPGAELLDDLIERARQPRDLAARHPLDPELLDELLHPPRRDAGQVGVGDHRHERLLRAPARLEQPVREVRALPQLRQRELDRPHPRVPVALPVAVAAVDPLRGALPVAGTAERLRLRAHQRLGEILDHRPQQIRARLLQLLAQPASNVHHVLGHRAPPRSSFVGLREDDAVVTCERARRRSALAYGSRSGDYLSAVVHHERGRYSIAISQLRSIVRACALWSVETR